MSTNNFLPEDLTTQIGHRRQETKRVVQPLAAIVALLELLLLNLQLTHNQLQSEHQTQR